MMVSPSVVVVGCCVGRWAKGVEGKRGCLSHATSGPPRPFIYLRLALALGMLLRKVAVVAAAAAGRGGAVAVPGGRPKKGLWMEEWRGG